MAQSVLEFNVEIDLETHAAALDSGLEKSPAQPLFKILSDFDGQLLESLELAAGINLSRLPSQPSSVLFCGMGGSAIGGDLLAAFLRPELSIPIAVNRDSEVPGWVSTQTLVIGSSYSGNTEETLRALNQARDRGAWVCAISSGGELARLAKEEKWPLLPVPGGMPPRMTLLYSMIPALVWLHRAGVCDDHASALVGSLEWVKSWAGALVPSIPSSVNPAKQLAVLLRDRVAVVIGGSSVLDVLARRWAGQLSENAKQLGFFSSLPEMAHNDVVGWLEGGEGLCNSLISVWLCDRGDASMVRSQREWIVGRMDALGVPRVRVDSQGNSPIERLWSLLLLGDYASLYLAILRGRDPLPVESIEDMKAQLKDRQPGTP